MSISNANSWLYHSIVLVVPSKMRKHIPLIISTFDTRCKDSFILFEFKLSRPKDKLFSFPQET
jgi:hypothetical protein